MQSRNREEETSIIRQGQVHAIQVVVRVIAGIQWIAPAAVIAHIRIHIRTIHIIPPRVARVSILLPIILLRIPILFLARMTRVVLVGEGPNICILTLSSTNVRDENR